MRPTSWFIAAVLLISLSSGLSRAEVNLLAMGDWGSGEKSQKQVAETLAGFVKSTCRKFDGMLLAGDNFYPALSGTRDPKWQTLFEQMYDPIILDFPFYVSLGNHDYQYGKDSIERDYTRENPQSRWKLPSRYYRLDLPADKPLVTVLMLNSNKPLMSDADWNAELFWMKTELEKPRTSRWLIACAHHPLFSNGDHGDNGVLQKAWEPLFRKYKLDMYICGHDHDVQHLEMPNLRTSLLLVGGGGKSIRPMRNDLRGPFSKSSYGFASMQFSGSEIDVRLISNEGELLHHFIRTPDREVKVLDTIASDPAKPRTVKSITRNEDSATTKNSKANDDD